MKRLKAALLGVTGTGAAYLDALRCDECFELIAVADDDPEAVREATEHTDIDGYRDNRSLVVESVRRGLEVLVIALEPFQAFEIALHAAGQGLAVFTQTPFARNHDEAKRLIRAFERTGRPLVAVRPWLFVPAYEPLRDLSQWIGRVHCAAATVRTEAPEPLDWRGDASRAGGGVLLYDAYETLDMLIHLLGVPDRVYAQCTRAIPPTAACPYDTEDAAVVILRYAGGRTASLAVARSTAPPTWSVSFFGEKGVMDVGPDHLQLAVGNEPFPTVTPVRVVNRIAPAVAALGRAFRDQTARVESAAASHAPTMAAIDAAYLSARTGSAESLEPFLP